MGVSLSQNSGVLMLGQGSAWQLVWRGQGLAPSPSPQPPQSCLEPATQEVGAWIGKGSGGAQDLVREKPRAELGQVDWGALLGVCGCCRILGPC